MRGIVLTTTGKNPCIHVGRKRLFFAFETVCDALLQLIPDPLSAAPQRVQRDPQAISHRLPVIDLVAPFILVILQDQLTTLNGQLVQAPHETLPMRAVFLVEGRYDNRAQFVQTDPAVVRLFERFEKDESGDALAVSGDVTNRLAGFQFADEAIDRLIGAFFGEAGAAPIKDFHQFPAEGFVFFARVLGVRIEGEKKPFESL